MVYLYKLNDEEMEKYIEQIQEIARFATNRGLEITLDNIEEITKKWYLSNKAMYYGLAEITKTEQKQLLKIK